MYTNTHIHTFTMLILICVIDSKDSFNIIVILNLPTDFGMYSTL